MKYTLLLFITLFAFGCQSNGQQKKTSKSSVTSLQPVPRGKGQTLQTVTERHYDGLQPGSIAPDAAIIDVDRIVYILNGALVVEKGNQTALMDVAGKFIVPWGKYSFDTYPPDIPSVAMFKATDGQTGKTGYLNSDGLPGISFTFESAEPFNNYKIAKVKLPRVQGQTMQAEGIVDYRGNFYQTDPKRQNYYFSLYTKGTLHSIRYDEYKYQNYILANDTFFNKAGKPTIPRTYIKAHDFSEGLAAVSQKDQFGQVKWGYIDTTGKLVIPFTYSIEPGDFHNNRALVTPQDKTAFDYAYIDHTGKVAFTIRYSAPGTLLRAPGNFLNGYQAKSPFSEREDVLIDTNNVAHKISEIIQDKTIKQEASGFTVVDANELGYILRNTKYVHINSIGMMNARGKVLFPFAFCDLKPDYYSSYAYAEHSNDLYKKDMTRGIINSQGVFVVAIKKTSTF